MPGATTDSRPWSAILKTPTLPKTLSWSSSPKNTKPENVPSGQKRNFTYRLVSPIRCAFRSTPHHRSIYCSSPFLAHHTCSSSTILVIMGLVTTLERMPPKLSLRTFPDVECNHSFSIPRFRPRMFVVYPTYTARYFDNVIYTLPLSETLRAVLGVLNGASRKIAVLDNANILFALAFQSNAQDADILCLL